MDITQLNIGASLTPEFLLNVQMGLVPGFRQERKFGLNPDVDLGADEFIWDGQEEYTYDTVNTEMFVVSTDTLDTQDIIVFGLVEVAGDWIEKNVTVPLNGLVPVSVGEFIRVFRMRIISAPRPAITTTFYCSAKSIAGVPIISELRAQISPNRTTTLMAMYTIPSGFTAFVYRVFFSVARNEDAIFDLEVRPFNGVFVDTAVIPIFEASKQFEVGYERISEKNDIRVRVSTITNNTKASASMHFILVDNKYINNTVSE